MKLLIKMVLIIALGAGEARAYINEFVVTPEYLRKTAVPLDFSVVERSPGQFSVMITIPRASARFGTATAWNAGVYVSASDLPPFDAKNPPVWVNTVIAEKNLQRKIELSVPKKDGPEVTRFIILPRRELARAVVYVHFDKPGYGGDIYAVPLGYFIPAEADRARQPMSVPPPAAPEPRQL